MKNRFKLNRLWSMLITLILASLACSIGNEKLAVGKSTVTVLQNSTIATKQPNSGESDLSDEGHLNAISSTVILTAVFPEGKDYSSTRIGTGAMISADGYILTSAYATNPSAFETSQDDPSYFLVGLVSQEDKAPINSYIAEVAGVDEFLDLAVLRIVSTIDGTKVVPDDLNLPFFKLGNPDEVRIGDPIITIGYRGEGKEAITSANSSFAGWKGEDPLGDHAWMKFDGLIFGFFGWAATNNQGQLLGVVSNKTYLAVLSNKNCRRLSDTNNDGKIDDDDECNLTTISPIYEIRPIIYAKDLIDTVQKGQEYISPYSK